jgi:hypothetical protein
LFAVTREGRVALTTDIELGADESPAEIELHVQPGCRLRIRYDGVSRDACYFVQMDGALLAQGTIVPGQAVDEFLPAGQPTVYLLEYRGSFAECLQPGKSGCQSRTTTLSVGDAAQVTFAAAPR